MQTKLATYIHDQEAEPRIRDLLLGALAVSSGAIDSISFLALGKVFSAFMTGNIVFLGFRVAGANAPSVATILTSIIAFAVGVYLSALIVKPTAGSGIWPARVTVALAVSLIPHAVFLAVWFASNGQPSMAGVNILIGLWALAMGMQSAAVRTLHVEGVFTTAATATVIVLASDISTWSITGAERRRLAGVLVSLFIGATAGGLLLVHAPIYAPVLPFVITVATVATAWTALRERNKSH
ncbi:MAG TPA: YoaK family protein [Verrucomicrobiae bacterium]|nr:YoaK family protein [Verrucomicrobiae bacterium]